MSERNKGILFILLAAFFFALMSILVRLAGDLPTMQKALFRNLVAVAVALILILKSGQKPHIGKENMPSTILRSAFGTLGLIANFYAVSHMTNVSDANMLNKLSPFFAMLMSIFILKEKASKKEWLIVVAAFAGALCVIKPGFNMDIAPALIGLIGGFGAGVAYTYVRKLGKNGVKGPVIVLFFSAFSCIVAIPFFIVQYTPMTLTQLLILLGVGGAAACGQISITAAYTHAPAKEISVFDYTQVIFAAIWGFILFDQLPDAVSLIGYIIIIAAAVVRFLYNRKK